MRLALALLLLGLGLGSFTLADYARFDALNVDYQRSSEELAQESGDQRASISFLFHGDWGWPGLNQSLVGHQMGNWSQRNRADFLIALGDNFYGQH
jgi:hypothetical protein